MKKKLIEMPVELFDKIEKAANENERSVNKEITNRLKKSFKNDK